MHKQEAPHQLAPGAGPLDVGDALVHGGVMDLDAQVVRPCDQRAAPPDLLDGPLPGVQDGVLAPQPALPPITLCCLPLAPIVW